MAVLSKGFLFWLYCQRVFCCGCTVKVFPVAVVPLKVCVSCGYVSVVVILSSVCQLWLYCQKCVSVVVVLSEVCVSCGCAVRSVWLCCQKCAFVLSEVCVSCGCVIGSVCCCWKCVSVVVVLSEVSVVVVLSEVVAVVVLSEVSAVVVRLQEM